jgi:parallel beta-helix repeat protein
MKGYSDMSRTGHVLVIIFIIVSCFTPIFLIFPSPATAYTPHDPISINGDDDFAAQAASEGWPGDGSEGNPYVIEGYEINATFAHGIAISNTEAHFIIINIIISGGQVQFSGIFFNIMSNGTIEDCDFSNNDKGVWIQESKNVIIVNCSFQFSNNFDVDITYSTNISLFNNIMNTNGITISGFEIEDMNSHNIDTSNELNGKPIYYWVNKNGGTIPPGAGQVILVSCTNITVQNQEISNARTGLLVAYSDNCTIRNNTLDSNILYGIQILKSHNNTIYNNIVTESHLEGIRIESSSGNVISENIVTGSNDSFSWGASGINIEFSKCNEITGNTVSDCISGITLDYSDENIVNSNLVTNNGYYSDWYDYGKGISLHMSHKNSIINNSILENTIGIGISYSYNNTIAGNTVSNNEQGSYIHSSRNTVFNNNSFVNDGLVFSKYEFEYFYPFSIFSNNTVNGKSLLFFNNLNEGVISKDAGQIILVNCSNVIIENQEISHTPIGIQLRSCHNNTMRNNSFHSNLEGGINLFTSNENTISNNTMTNNEYGIYLYDSHANVITNNIANSNWGHGIIIEESDHNIITQNNASNNIRSGIDLDTSDVNIITNNTAISNGFQHNEGGISFGSSDENDVSENIIISNNNGLYFTLSNNNYCKGNIFISNQNGVCFSSSSFNNITGNDIRNSSDGINLQSSDNVIYGNRISECERGIFNHWSSRNNIIGNTILNNNEGIALRVSSDNIISENGLLENTLALRLDSSRRNNIHSNTISNNKHGLFLDWAHDNNVTDNSFSNSDGPGIHLSNSRENYIGTNLVSQNEYGLLFEHFSDENEIIFNTIESNREYGIFLNESDDNLFHHNYILNNNQQLMLINSNNTWDNSHGEGNFWSDYNGVDEDDDGVGETKLPHQGVDRFPLTNRKKDILSDPLLLVFILPLIVLSLIIIYSLVRRGKSKKDDQELKEKISEGEQKAEEIQEQQPKPPISPPTPPEVKDG